MLRQPTLTFLKDLKKNNNKEWFEKNRSRYEDAKADFEHLAAAVLRRLSASDESIAHLRPKDCLFRINRDIRFSKNKDPYKTNMAMSISRDGKKVNSGGYYFHAEPGKSYVAGGIWMPAAPELKKIRQEIDYNFDAFQQVLGNRKFRAAFGDLSREEGAMLSRPPKGYDAHNPAIEYLKFKSIIVSAEISDAELVSAGLVKTITGQFGLMRPLVSFINAALE